MGDKAWTWTCHHYVLKCVSSSVLLSSSLQQFLPSSSTALPPSFISFSLFPVFPHHVLSFDSKEPGVLFHSLFPLIPSFSSSICLIERLPFDQNKPTSCFYVLQLTRTCFPNHARPQWPRFLIPKRSVRMLLTEGTQGIQQLSYVLQYVIFIWSLAAQ